MIFAAGVTARLLASAVASVLDAYYNGKRALTQDKIHRPAINGTGDAIRDADGNVAYEVIMMQSVEGSQQERLFAGIDAGLVKLQIAAGDSGGRTTRP